MTRALVIIDIQNDYFPGGAHPLVGPDAATEAASTVLRRFRKDGDAVIHVQHVWDAPDAAFMRPGTRGIRIHDAVAPLPGEPIVQKTEPNAFLRTDLQDRLTALSPDEVVMCGMMTNLCVDASVRAASDLGFAVTLVHDACAASDLHFDGATVPGAVVHTAFVAALNHNYATVASARDISAR